MKQFLPKLPVPGKKKAKAAFLLLAINCISMGAFAASTWYSVGSNANDYTAWNSLATGLGSAPTGSAEFAVSGDTWIMQSSMSTDATISGGAWIVAGSVSIGTTATGVVFSTKNTVTIDGSLTMGNDAEFDGSSGLGRAGGVDIWFNGTGNLTVSSSAWFNASGYNRIILNGGTTINWTSAAQSKYTTFLDISGVTLASNLPLPYGNSGSHYPGGTYAFAVAANLDCGTYQIGELSSDNESFYFYPTTQFTTANTDANGAIFGSLGHAGFSYGSNSYVAISTVTLDPNAAYVFDGSAMQHTGSSGVAGAYALPAAITGYLYINNNSGVILDQATDLSGGRLGFTSGILNIGSNNLTLGLYIGTPSASKMIEADGSGKVVNKSSGAGQFTYPIGYFSSGYYYSPITVTVNSVTITGSTFNMSVNVTPSEEPHNTNVSDYLKLYWSMSISGTSAVNYDVTALYPSAAIQGTDANISMGEYSGGTWTKLGAANTSAKSITTTGFGGVTNTSADFTGISTCIKPNVSSLGTNGSYSAITYGTLVSVTSGTLANGAYTVTYNLGGANTATGNTAAMAFSSGTGTFTTSTLTHTGITTVTITNIALGSCSSAVSGGNTAAYSVNAAPAGAAGPCVCH